MKSTLIRKEFLKFFESKKHTIVSSSSLIPLNDPTLLFTNAGMVQFKEYFLGQAIPKFKRATSIQCCLRAGGKHNDLENVGYTYRHLTFFEMLGNFSFGDYFKRDAIIFSWEFLRDIMQLPEDRLWITVYKDDNEAAKIWMDEIGIKPNRITYCGEEDNFWSMGPVGPCGPCTEIFYDHGPEVKGGPPGSPNASGDRFVEIWNLVFMQNERLKTGELKPLPMLSVDTGMGLERIAAVLQGVHDIYETDQFRSLIHAVKSLSPINNNDKISLKVIADHIRSVSFLIAEGVIPNNEGRGYVLRRIIRRAIRYGHKLGFESAFFYKLVEALVSEMGETYPILVKNKSNIESVIRREEEQFGKTLRSGLKLLENDLRQLENKIIPGQVIFRMYDTYGFPVDLLTDIAKERNLTLDNKGFDEFMRGQKQLARQASKFPKQTGPEILPQIQDSSFVGYQNFQHSASVISLISNGTSKDSITEGEEGGVILDITPFYAEAGGQVGDKGKLIGNGIEFIVQDTQSIGKKIVHYGKLIKGNLIVGDSILALIDISAREATKLNHTATHLLHAVLRSILGNEVTQKGSLVSPDKLRFDFSFPSPLSRSQLLNIEKIVNEKIRENMPVNVEILDLEDATKSGAMALFGEKYEEKVRVLTISDFSKELCGGTHVQRTGDIGLFKIVSESAVAAGIRRIEAITGLCAVEWVQSIENQSIELSRNLNTSISSLTSKVQQLLEENKQLQKNIEKLETERAYELEKNLQNEVRAINGVNFLIAKIDSQPVKTVRLIAENLRAKFEKALIIIISITETKMVVVATATRNCLKLSPTPKEVVEKLCGQGGGRDDMAQGGSFVPTDLDERIKQIIKLIETQR